MSFVVYLAHQVEQAVSELAPPLQWHFTQIVEILIEDPFPHPKFYPIKEFWLVGGPNFYEYFDGIVPLVFQYRVYTSDVEGVRGMVYISKAIAPVQ